MFGRVWTLCRRLRAKSRTAHQLDVILGTATDGVPSFHWDIVEAICALFPRIRNILGSTTMCNDLHLKRGRQAFQPIFGQE